MAFKIRRGKFKTPIRRLTLFETHSSLQNDALVRRQRVGSLVKSTPPAKLRAAMGALPRTNLRSSLSRRSGMPAFVSAQKVSRKAIQNVGIPTLSQVIGSIHAGFISEAVDAPTPGGRRLLVSKPDSSDEKKRALFHQRHISELSKLATNQIKKRSTGTHLLFQGDEGKTIEKQETTQQSKPFMAGGEDLEGHLIPPGGGGRATILAFLNYHAIDNYYGDADMDASNKSDNELNVTPITIGELLELRIRNNHLRYANAKYCHNELSKITSNTGGTLAGLRSGANKVMQFFHEHVWIADAILGWIRQAEESLDILGSWQQFSYGDVQSIYNDSYKDYSHLPPPTNFVDGIGEYLGFDSIEVQANFSNTRAYLQIVHDLKMSLSRKWGVGSPLLYWPDNVKTWARTEFAPENNIEGLPRKLEPILTVNGYIFGGGIITGEDSMETMGPAVFKGGGFYNKGGVNPAGWDITVPQVGLLDVFGTMDGIYEIKHADKSLEISSFFLPLMVLSRELTQSSGLGYLHSTPGGAILGRDLMDNHMDDVFGSVHEDGILKAGEHHNTLRFFPMGKDPDSGLEGGWMPEILHPDIDPVVNPIYATNLNWDIVKLIPFNPPGAPQNPTIAAGADLVLKATMLDLAGIHGADYDPWLAGDMKNWSPYSAYMALPFETCRFTIEAAGDIRDIDSGPDFLLNSIFTPNPSKPLFNILPFYRYAQMYDLNAGDTKTIVDRLAGFIQSQAGR